MALIPCQMPEEVPSAETHFLTAHFQLCTHKEKYYTTVYSTLDIKQTKAERSTCFSLGVDYAKTGGLGIVRSPQNRRVRWNIPE